MHLPFTFTTGEAMLYQTGYPLRSFSEPVPGRAKGSKSRKGGESSADNLDPKSLLGALMSQDESVYVRQGDGEPSESCSSSSSSSLWSQPPPGGEGSSFFSTSLHVGSEERSSYDPLLATLDSLTLDGEDPCSNTELFNALEGLGLNAEDLELLLLDERMIQVELDPDHIPTLSDLLTNNEILSYTRSTLESSPEQTEGGVCPRGVNADPPAVPASPPIIQLSQQMQQHISSGELVKASPPPVETKAPTGLPLAHWGPNNHVLQPRPVLTPSQLNSQLKHLLESSQPWSQDQHLLHHQQVSQDPPLLGFHHQMNASCIADAHASFLPSLEVGHTRSITAAPDVCPYQSYRQSSTLELEQLLGLSQSQHGLPAYSMFNTSPQSSAHSKVRHPPCCRCPFISVWASGEAAAADGSRPFLRETSSFCHVPTAADLVKSRQDLHLLEMEPVRPLPPKCPSPRCCWIWAPGP